MCNGEDDDNDDDFLLLLLLSLFCRLRSHLLEEVCFLFFDLDDGDDDLFVDRSSDVDGYLRGCWEDFIVVVIGDNKLSQTENAIQRAMVGIAFMASEECFVSQAGKETAGNNGALCHVRM